MTRMVERRRLPWSAADAAALILDWSRDGEWRPAVTAMEAEPGPARPGQRIVERLRVGLLPVVVPLRVVAADAASATVEGVNGVAASRARRSVTPEADGGCTVELELELRPRGMMALLDPLLAPGYRRVHRADADSLAALTAHSGPAYPVSTSPPRS